MRNDLYTKNIRGIGLVEVALFVIAAGFVMAAGTPVYKTYEVHKHFDATNNNIAATKAALDAFYRKNARFPCPSSRTAAIDGPGFGIENCTGGPPGSPVVKATGNPATPDIPSPHDILTGAVPIRTLGLPDTAAIDGWNHLLTYSITKAYTVKGTAGTSDLLHGVIYAQDSKGNPATQTAGTAVYVVSGANPDGSGAYTTSGTLLPCGATGLELQRCNADGSKVNPFISSTLQASQGQKAVGNPIALGGGSCIHLATAPSGGGGKIGNISFLVDTSGSMASNDITTSNGGRTTRISAAKSALNTVIPSVMQSKAQNDPTNLVGMGTFATFRPGGSCANLSTTALKSQCLFSGFSASDVATGVTNQTTAAASPVSINSSSYCGGGSACTGGASGTMVNAVNGMSANGNTPLYDTMINMGGALQNGTSTKPNILVIVTDGQDTASRNSNSQMIDNLAANYPNMQVAFVYVGNQQDNPQLRDAHGNLMWDANGQPYTKMENEIFQKTAAGNQLKGSFINTQNSIDILNSLQTAITPPGDLCPQQ